MSTSSSRATGELQPANRQGPGLLWLIIPYIYILPSFLGTQGGMRGDLLGTGQTDLPSAKLLSPLPLAHDLKQGL